MAKKKDRLRKPADGFKYRVDIIWSPEDGAYIAKVPELDGCVTHGDSVETAAVNAEDAILGYLESLVERGLAIPTPLSEQKFSGKIPLRIDPNLHRDLVVKAQTEGTSLNKFIENRLKKIG
jgi:predicted RNase H-like HicB family nuclease